jgi:hypothetical protein
MMIKSEGFPTFGWLETLPRLNIYPCRKFSEYLPQDSI